LQTLDLVLGCNLRVLVIKTKQLVELPACPTLERLCLVEEGKPEFGDRVLLPHLPNLLVFSYTGPVVHVLRMMEQMQCRQLTRLDCFQLPDLATFRALPSLRYVEIMQRTDNAREHARLILKAYPTLAWISLKNHWVCRNPA
jgi:hypothetical protein